MSNLTNTNYQLSLKARIPNIPELDLSHIKRMTNATGIIQHAKFYLPNYHHGYSVDDNARALLLCGMVNKIFPTNDVQELIDTYIGYIYYMQTENGRFRNFLSYDLQFLDDEGTEDSFGRTVWALGSVMKNYNTPHIQHIIKEIVDKAYQNVTKLKSVKAVAYTICGLCYLAQSTNYDKDTLPQIKILAQYLCSEYQQASNEKWQWFEEVLSYNNAIVPYSLLLAADLLQDDDLQKIALESFSFLENSLFDKDRLHLIGNENWYIKGQSKSEFGQQAVEIPSLILMYQLLSKLTPSDHYTDRSIVCLEWFLGKNSCNKPLYDSITKGCCDGIDRHGINLNQGAESTISFWQSYMYVLYNTN